MKEMFDELVEDVIINYDPDNPLLIFQYNR